ncbi:MAG: hypothetical protein ACI9J3_000001, partial [Parvicellaceae bacterium]
EAKDKFTNESVVSSSGISIKSLDSDDSEPQAKRKRINNIGINLAINQK